jgi:hypothetical protein
MKSFTLSRFVAFCAIVGTASTVAARSVIPPTFSELVSNATEIFIGHVVSRESRWVDTPAGPVIFTDVTFGVEEILKGNQQQQTTLRFRGGTVGDVTLAVADMPKFAPGDRDLLFVESRNAVSPLVGFMHGRFRIQRELSSGIDRIATHDGRPLAATASLGPAGPGGQGMGIGRGLSLSDFRAEILARIRAGIAR